mmetsp:Transcript_36523/g.72359  ORF Transcript_36523/g.72359 Transcript_36523/m.72359 type:complete len:97 (-) Transcript_36523:11-301(-)
MLTTAVPLRRGSVAPKFEKSTPLALVFPALRRRVLKVLLVEFARQSERAASCDTEQEHSCCSVTGYSGPRAFDCGLYTKWRIFLCAGCGCNQTPTS